MGVVIVEARFKERIQGAKHSERISKIINRRDMAAEYAATWRFASQLQSVPKLAPGRRPLAMALQPHTSVGDYLQPVCSVDPVLLH